MLSVWRAERKEKEMLGREEAYIHVKELIDMLEPVSNPGSA